MKHLSLFSLLAILLFTVSTGKANPPEEGQKINWISLEEAQELVKKEPRKILIDVYTHWCGPCKLMMRNTFSNPKIIAYINEHYYAVKFNAEGPEAVNFKGEVYENPQYVENRSGRNGTHQLTGAIAAVNGRIAYPTIVYMDEDLNILQPIQGYLQPAQIEPILKYFGENAYKTLSAEEFMENFESEL